MATRRKLLRVRYLDKEDLLHVQLGEGPFDTMELSNGVLLHVDRETQRRIGGCTIRNFRARSREGEGEWFDVPLTYGGIADFLDESEKKQWTRRRSRPR